MGAEIVLQKNSIEDAPTLLRAINESLDHLRPWMPWAKAPVTRGSIEEYLRTAAADWDEKTEFQNLITSVSGTQLVGGCGLHSRSSEGVLEIGYFLLADHVGRGHATSAVWLLTSAAFSLPEVNAVEIHHDKANVRSSRVPQRLGYRFLGEQPDRPMAPDEIGVDLTWRIERRYWNG